MLVKKSCKPIACAYSMHVLLLHTTKLVYLQTSNSKKQLRTGPALTLGRVGRLPRAEGLRGPPSSKKGPQDVLVTKFIC